MTALFALRSASITLAVLVILAATPTIGEDRQKISFMMSAAASKYTQQHAIDIGDAPGHQIRISEIHRTFTNEPFAFAGVRVTEVWSGNVSDYIDGNGPTFGYSVFVLTSGDKIFARFEGVTQTVSGADGSAKTTVTTVVTVTGGTGRFKGIRGMWRTLGDVDFKGGLNRTRLDGEYWIEK